MAGKKLKAPRKALVYYVAGGKGGIRTHGTASCTPDFESGPFDHSGTFRGFRNGALGMANPEEGAFYMYRIGLTRKLHFFATSKSAYLWLLLAPIIVASLYWHWRPLPSPYISGELVVLTRESPTTYFLDAEGKPAGFEYELATEFAKEHGWTLKLEVAKEIGRAHV